MKRRTLKRRSISSTFKIFTLVIILAAISAAILLAAQNQQFRQYASSQFATGFNITGITHYGYPQFPNAPSSQVDLNLSEAKRMGATIVRVYVPRNEITDQEAANRLSAFLQKADTYGISVIPVFIDLYSAPWHKFSPQGTEQYYTVSYNGLMLLNHSFFVSGYQGRYKEFVATVINSNKQHTNIYAWEVGNELKDSDPTSGKETFKNFMIDMTNYIKSLDSTHAVATGMLNSAHPGFATPQEIYGVLPSVSIVTVHAYNGNRSAELDVVWANQNGKQALIEEIGISGSGDRSIAVTNEVAYWKQKGAAGVLQWGFLAKQITADNGNGDNTYGMDSIWHTDYDALSVVYQSFTSSPSATPTSTSTPSPTRTPTSTLPAPWQSQDIGSVMSAGSASFTNNTFTLKASGADIWNNADEFYFVYQQMTDDVTLVTRVDDLTNTNSYAKAGIMIRESLDANSKNAFLGITPKKGIKFQYRTKTADKTGSSGSSGKTPYWLKLERKGNTFTAYKSSNGTSFVKIKSITFAMNQQVYIGLALSSHADGTLTTGIFSGVLVTDN